MIPYTKALYSFYGRKEKSSFDLFALLCGTSAKRTLWCIKHIYLVIFSYIRNNFWPLFVLLHKKQKDIPGQFMQSQINFADMYKKEKLQSRCQRVAHL